MGDGEPLAKEKGGEPEGTSRTKKLESLREGDADLPDGDVIQNVRETDAGHRGDDQNDIYACADVERRRDFSERQRKR